MTLPSSGALYMSDIVGEFGGPGTALTDYYRGGSYVPDTSTNSGVPTSGAIYITDFYGAAAVSDHNTTITVGSAIVFTTHVHLSAPYPTITTAYSSTGYGYDGGADYFSHSGTFGTMASPTYTDAGGTSRTITSSYWATGYTNLYLTMSGSVPNTDTSFISWIVGGTTFARSSATYDSGTPSGNTTWQWSTGTNPFGMSGTVNVTVKLT